MIEMFIMVKMKYLPTWMKKGLAFFSQLLFLGLILTGGLVIFHNVYFTPIKIVGSSMAPTLNDQEFGIMNARAKTARDFNRFDIVIVKESEGSSRYLIKRLIGFPLETIALTNTNEIRINGNSLIQSFELPMAIYAQTCFRSDAIGCSPIVLGVDEYFLLGDNRGFSTDSRILGPFQESLIMGKLVAIEGVCLETTLNEETLSDDCSRRQYFWPRIYA